MKRSRTKRAPEDDELVVRRREEILRHAVVHFAHSGYAEADLDAIAADVGCAKGTLYRYFHSKEDLFTSSVDLVMRKLLDATSKADSEDPLEQLEHAIRAYLEFFAAHPEYVELLIQERAAFRDRKKSTYFEHRDASAERWRKRLLDLMRAGRLRTMPAERALDAVGRLLYGTIFTNYFIGRGTPPRKQADEVLDVLFHGLLAPSERDRRLLPRRSVR